MVVLARRASWLAALAASACFPVPDPVWLIVRPELLAVRIDLTTPGPLSALVARAPADRVRTEMLPGDRATLHPWVVDPTKVWDEADLDVAYFACFGVQCADSLNDVAATEPCTLLVNAGAGVCLVGRGPGVEFTLPAGPPEFIAPGIPEIFAIAGVPGVRDTDDCIAAVRARPREDLGECMMLERTVAVGPTWVLAVLQQGGDPLALDDETTGGDVPPDYVPPPEAVLEWPNFNPAVERFSVTIGGQGDTPPIDAVASDRIAVRAGDRVQVAVLVDPRDAQQSAIAVDAVGNVTRRVELTQVDWFANYLLSGPFVAFPDAQYITWDVPRDVDEVRIDVRIVDGRGGVGWGSLYFEVDGTAG